MYESADVCIVVRSYLVTKNKSITKINVLHLNRLNFNQF